MIASPAIDIANVVYHYGDRRALDRVDLQVGRGEIFALLGPNGGGKSTLFRLLTTLVPLGEGTAQVLGLDLVGSPEAIRRRIGVVFQAPSIDKKLTVRENLIHQGHLYGLSGVALRQATATMLERLGVADRADDFTEQLSGGLRRRVEIAKGMLHGPELLLMDEPSTGLDPGARADLWRYLEQIRAEHGTTIVVTTHFLDEAEHADRLAILDAGRVVALGTPDELKASVGGDTITITTPDPAALVADVGTDFGLDAKRVGDALHLQQTDGHTWVSRLVEQYGERILTISLGQPTLEDVFISKTGHRFWADAESVDG